MIRSLLAALALAWMTVAGNAMSVTFTDVQYAEFRYIPSGPGVFTIEYSFTFGAVKSIYPGLFPPTYYDFGICGLFYTTCLPYSAGGQAGVCSGDQDHCSFSQYVTVAIQKIAPDQYYSDPNGVFFYVDVGSPRDFISSSITFTGPDPIPLPASLPLMGAALVGLGFIGWRKRLRWRWHLPA